MDAGIVHVHHDHMVNLSVCDNVGQTHMVPSVPLLAGQWEPSDAEYMVCEWMPFQKGQAAKAVAAPGALETKSCADGTLATGPGPLPEASPAEQSNEDEIQAKGLTAPRVTLAHLQAHIAQTEIVKHVSPSGQLLRWAVLTTRNGFAVTGRPSAAVSPANDNAEIGEKVAIDNAIKELWP